MYYGYRFYDPETGRWPSRDPIEEQGGLNLYGFVENDGVNKWDNLGLEIFSVHFNATIRPPDPNSGVKAIQKVAFDEYGNIVMHWESIGPTPSPVRMKGGGTITPATVTGAHPFFSVRMKGSVYAKPLVGAGWLVPNPMGPITSHNLVIDWDITIDFDLCHRAIRITGSHDGYPSYTITTGAAVYDFQQKPATGSGGYGLHHLLPPMEESVFEEYWY